MTNYEYTVNPHYNGHIRFQRFCRYNESAVVAINLLTLQSLTYPCNYFLKPSYTLITCS
jgi:hypothetical protein